VLILRFRRLRRVSGPRPTCATHTKLPREQSSGKNFFRFGKRNLAQDEPHRAKQCAAQEKYMCAFLASAPAAAHGAAVGSMPAPSADMLVEPTFCVSNHFERCIENEERMCDRVMTYGDGVENVSGIYVRYTY